MCNLLVYINIGCINKVVKLTSLGVDVGVEYMLGVEGC